MTVETPSAGPVATREAIFSAAAALFRQDGYAATGVRDIAAGAGVTPALVLRYFGSKEQLFLATIALDSGFADIMLGPLPGLGERLVAYLLSNTAPDSTGGGIFSALIRASDRPAIRESLQQSLDTTIVAPLSPRLTGTDADVRARLVAAHIAGLLTSLDILVDRALLAADRATVIRLYGRGIQALLDGT